MAQTVVIRFFLFLGSAAFFLSCSTIEKYEVNEVNRKAIFRPYIKSPASSFYRIHVEGYLDGSANIELLLPEFDPTKIRTYPVGYLRNLDSGRVDKYLYGDYFGGFEKPNLLYTPGTAQKGHLKITIVFDRELPKK
ncbi:MAG: hypothetical protein U0X91_24115 [Spirosomataceae bacterium]